MALNLNLNFNLKALPWKAQLGTSVGLAVAGVAAFWYFLAVPMQEDNAGRRARLATLQEEIARGVEAGKARDKFQRDLVGLQSQLQALRTQLPEEQDVADLLRRVQAMATESNLTILGFTPRAVTRKDLHKEWPIGLQMEGTYHDVGTFLERVSKFPRIINVGNIQITARDKQEGGATVTANCTATAFVLVSPAEEQSDKAKAAKGKA